MDNLCCYDEGTQQQYEASINQEEYMKFRDSGNQDFEQPPVGSHLARCVRVIDIGTQRGEYKGQATAKRQCIIAWELPAELITQGEYKGQPFIVSKFYTASLNEKANLRHDLENWRGREFTEQELQGFDSRNVLNKPCMLSVIHNEKGRAKVAGVMGAPKGVPVPDQHHPTIFFSLDEFDKTTFDSLTDGYKRLIMSSPEYQAVSSTPARSGGIADMEDDAPFARLGAQGEWRVV